MSRETKKDLITDKLTPEQFSYAWKEADSFSWNQAAYISEMLTSCMFNPINDDNSMLDMTKEPVLRRIWVARVAPFSVFLESVGLTQTKCSKEFCIPLRTVQHWALGERNCPPYVRLMIAKIMSYL